ncbi:hypothetical protein A4G20_09985 [Pasteurellaceae bacterium RH1A]|nr:hypothetical protein A4G20_09985 [Pasteurellaceae bacterium RH1A]
MKKLLCLFSVFFYISSYAHINNELHEIAELEAKNRKVLKSSNAKEEFSLLFKDFCKGIMLSSAEKYYEIKLSLVFKEKLCDCHSKGIVQEFTLSELSAMFKQNNNIYNRQERVDKIFKQCLNKI